MNNTVSSW